MLQQNSVAAEAIVDAVGDRMRREAPSRGALRAVSDRAYSVVRELRASTAAASGFGAFAAGARCSPARMNGRISDRVALSKSPRDSPTPYWMTSRCFEGM